MTYAIPLPITEIAMRKLTRNGINPFRIAKLDQVCIYKNIVKLRQINSTFIRICLFTLVVEIEFMPFQVNLRITVSVTTKGINTFCITTEDDARCTATR